MTLEEARAAARKCQAAAEEAEDAAALLSACKDAVHVITVLCDTVEALESEYRNKS